MSVDPVFRAIERHRKAYAARNAALDIPPLIPGRLTLLQAEEHARYSPAPTSWFASSRPRSRAPQRSRAM